VLLGVGLGLGLGEELSLGVGLGEVLSRSEDTPALVLEDVVGSGDVASVDDESDVVGVSVGDGLSVGELVSLGVGLAESSSDAEDWLADSTALVLRVVATVPPLVAALFEEVRTVDVAGGDPQSELESAIDACAARELTNNIATPKSASPIAAPSAAGLRIRALTVRPRINEPV
jgi:hypothetical protein